MISIRRRKWTRYASTFLVLTFVATLSPIPASYAQVAEEEPTTVLLMPVTDNTGSGVSGISRMASGIVQLAVDGVPGMECTDFGRTSAMVRRAVSEGRLLPVQVEKPTTDPAQAIQVAHAVMLDQVMIAQVESMRKVEHSPMVVELVVSGSLYDVAKNFNDATKQSALSPMVERAFGVIGTSKPRANYTGSLRPMVREALEDAAYKISQIMVGASAVDIAGARAKPTGHSRSGIRLQVFILGVGLLVALVAGSGGDKSGPSPAAKPPVPLRVELEPTAVRLYWDTPTGTTLALLGYQIDRSDNGAPWQRLADPAQADASRTNWPDFNVFEGHTYQYRIRAIYTNQAYSEWKLFTAVLYNPNPI